MSVLTGCVYTTYNITQFNNKKKPPEVLWKKGLILQRAVRLFKSIEAYLREVY
tara:strand:- start:2102 stop:2260 length:159 start_codon:yes stop_codon:yes gene_type:complete